MLYQNKNCENIYYEITRYLQRMQVETQCFASLHYLIFGGVGNLRSRGFVDRYLGGVYFLGNGFEDFGGVFCNDFGDVLRGDFGGVFCNDFGDVLRGDFGGVFCNDFSDVLRGDFGGVVRGDLGGVVRGDLGDVVRGDLGDVVCGLYFLVLSIGLGNFELSEGIGACGGVTDLGCILLRLVG
jgi:hypothetical protein